MRINETVHCPNFPCQGVAHQNYAVPDIEIDPLAVSIVMISECAAPNPADGYYTGDQALFARTTLLAFQDAGAPFKAMSEILAAGVYLTTAVKCGKTTYGIETAAVDRCSYLLEQELELFHNVRAYLLMGDVAIKAVNRIARRAGQPRPILAGSTYKIRGGEFFFRGARAFPSYLQAGPSFFIEKSKRQMIAEDIASALLIAAN
jgi:uracil-DNA glycosylase